MITRVRPACVFLWLALVAITPRLGAEPAKAPPTDAQLVFLRTARVVSSRPIGRGITGALRLTLSDGALTHDASFQSVDQRARDADISAGRRTAGELRFVDSYRYNIAAWELSRDHRHADGIDCRAAPRAAACAGDG